MNAPLTNAALLEKDHQHMIHPLHHTAGHANGRVWVKGEGSFFLTSTVNPHKSLIYKEKQKYLGTTNAQILKDYINQYSG